jgi:hypothetical protein
MTIVRDDVFDLVFCLGENAAKPLQRSEEAAQPDSSATDRGQPRGSSQSIPSEGATGNRP